MGFLEKVKNMFTEEVEEEDIKVEKVKSEVTHVAIDSPNARTEDKIDDFLEEIRKEPEEVKPIFFDESDFKDLNLIDKYDEKPEIKPIYGNKLVSEKAEEPKKIFKPTPIISPVYGVLDKNYHKEDIVSKNETRVNHPPIEPSIDSVRDKAYGTLEDELENTLFGSNSILFKKEDKSEDKLEVKELDDDILTDLTDDISKELDELLLKKEKYYDTDSSKDVLEDDEDLLGFIDSTLYKDGDEE